MRDLALLFILLGMAWPAWRRPWLGVLGLAGALAYSGQPVVDLGDTRTTPPPETGWREASPPDVTLLVPP